MRDLTDEERLLLVVGVLIGVLVTGLIGACLSRGEYTEPKPEPWRDYSRMPTVEDETEAERLEHEELTRKTL